MQGEVVGSDEEDFRSLMIATNGRPGITEYCVAMIVMTIDLPTTRLIVPSVWESKRTAPAIDRALFERNRSHGTRPLCLGWSLFREETVVKF